MGKSIIVNTKDDEFFIAICQYHLHSYVTLGVKRKDEDDIHLLASVGKVRKVEKTENTKSIWLTPKPYLWLVNTVVDKTPAYINEEPVLDYATQDEKETLAKEALLKKRARPLEDSAEKEFSGDELTEQELAELPAVQARFTPSKTNIRYKAYAISYKQYLDFLSHLQAICNQQQGNLLGAFCPLESESETGQVTLQWSEVRNLYPQNDELIFGDSTGNIEAFANTCRHTTMDMAQKTRNEPNLGRGISSQFFKAPPLKASFEAGQVCSDSYFYILPDPPSSFAGMSKEQETILNTLYRRLDKMLLIQHDPEKFIALKALYLETIPNDNKQRGINEIMDNIERWEENNWQLIAKHRRNHWFKFPTATESMFSLLNSQFAEIRKNQETYTS